MVAIVNWENKKPNKKVKLNYPSSINLAKLAMLVKTWVLNLKEVFTSQLQQSYWVSGFV